MEQNTSKLERDLRELALRNIYALAAGMLSAEEYEYYDCGAVAASCQGDCCGDTRQEESETGRDDGGYI